MYYFAYGEGISQLRTMIKSGLRAKEIGRGTLKNAALIYKGDSLRWRRLSIEKEADRKTDVFVFDIPSGALSILSKIMEEESGRTKREQAEAIMPDGSLVTGLIHNTAQIYMGDIEIKTGCPAAKCVFEDLTVARAAGLPVRDIKAALYKSAPSIEIADIIWERVSRAMFDSFAEGNEYFSRRRTNVNER